MSHYWFELNQDKERIIARLKRELLLLDQTIRDLETELEWLKGKVTKLETHISYMPDGEGYLACQEHFQKLVQQEQNTGSLDDDDSLEPIELDTI